MLRLNEPKIVEKDVNGMPRLKYTQPGHTLYSFSWGSIHVDEAHECRTGKALWRSICAAFEMCLVKVLMTATPLLEQAEVRNGAIFAVYKLF